MTGNAQPILSHVGLHAWDLDRMVDFYRGVFGMIVTDEGVGRTTGTRLAFLSGSPEHHHQLVLAAGRPAEATFSTVMQLSFLVSSIAALREARDRALAMGGSGLLCLNHGTSLSAYVDDPEGNRIEIYFETPFYIPQPHGDPLDLDRSDEEILRDTEELCRSSAGFMLREDWMKTFGTKSAAVDMS